MPPSEPTRDTFAVQRKYEKARADAVSNLAALGVVLILVALAVAPAIVILAWKAAL